MTWIRFSFFQWLFSGNPNQKIEEKIQHNPYTTYVYQIKVRGRANLCKGINCYSLSFESVIQEPKIDYFVN